MKRPNLIKLALLCGILTSYPQSILAAERAFDPAALEASVSRGQERVRAYAQLHQNALGTVVVLGETGAGKTTLNQFLANRDLLAVPGARGFKLQAVNPLPEFNIGMDAARGTLEPCLWHDAARNIRFIDFPGFNDPGGIAQEITNAFFAKQLIEGQTQVRFLLTLSETDFDEPRYSNLADRLGKLVNMFESMGQLTQALNVVITKQTDMTDTIFQNVRDEAEGDNENHLNRNPRVMELVRFLANHGPTRVSFFPKPLQVGAYQNPNCFQRIFRNLGHATPVNTPTIRVSVSPQAREIVSTLGQRFNTSLTDYIRNQQAQLIIDHCTQRISHFPLGPIATLRAEFANLLGQLQTVTQLATPDNPMDFANRLNSILHVDNLSHRICTLKFLRDINNAVTYDTAAWAEALRVTIQNITSLTVAPQCEYGNGTLLLKGNLLGSSDVNRALVARINQHDTRPILALRVFSLNTLLIDENLTLPGTLVALISPHTRVFGQRIINLCGAHGANGQDGGPGLPGTPASHGQHGGHLFGFSSVYENINGLSVLTTGGNGGRGGNGGNGADGIPGIDGNLAKVTENRSVRYQSGKYPEIDEFWEYHDQGTDGTPGQNSGQGGRGGLAGKNGTVLIDGQWNNAIQNAVATEGDNGITGVAGMGGKHGQHCTGTKKENSWKPRRGDWQKNGEHYTVVRAHLPRNPASAPNGINPQGFNDVGQSNQLLQIPLNGDALRQEYSDFYNAQGAANPFVRSFPNLQ